MAVMPNENTEYEKFVRSITEALLRAQGLETVAVQHDVQIQGISRPHQIDVYWEYRIGGILHRVIINCKRYSKTVEVTDILTLSGVLADLPGVRGLIVTTVGYQKGAIDYAKAHHIGLKIIRPPQDDDWNGRIRTMRVLAQIIEPELISCNFRFNREWAEANVPGGPDSLEANIEVDATLTTVRDLRTGSVSDLNDLWNQALRENPTGTGQEGSGVLRWEDARLERPGAPSLRVAEIEFRWRMVDSGTLTSCVRSAPAAIVRDAIAGTLLFVDPDGRITGDVEEELGARRSK